MRIFHEFQLVNHSGVNCGLNCAESVNFGSKKILESFGKFELCQCTTRNRTSKIRMAVEKLAPHRTI